MARETLRSFVGFQKWISENQFKRSMWEPCSSVLLTRRELRSEWTRTIFGTRLLTACWTKESVFSTSKFLSVIPTSRQHQSISSGLIQERRFRLFSGELGREIGCRAAYFLPLEAWGKNSWVSRLGKSSECQNPFGIFLACANALGTAWEKALRMIGDFWKSLQNFYRSNFWRFEIRLDFFETIWLSMVSQSRTDLVKIPSAGLGRHLGGWGRCSYLIG